MAHLIHKVFIIIAICVTSATSQATISNKVRIQGTIVAFDQTTITVKSGQTKKVYKKADLKFPSYKVGDRIEIETTMTELAASTKKGADR